MEYYLFMSRSNEAVRLWSCGHNMYPKTLKRPHIILLDKIWNYQMIVWFIFLSSHEKNDQGITGPTTYHFIEKKMPPERGPPYPRSGHESAIKLWITGSQMKSTLGGPSNTPCAAGIVDEEVVVSRGVLVWPIDYLPADHNRFYGSFDIVLRPFALLSL